LQTETTRSLDHARQVYPQNFGVKKAKGLQNFEEALQERLPAVLPVVLPGFFQDSSRVLPVVAVKEEAKRKWGRHGGLHGHRMFSLL
jgi:hypothetical protein